MPWRKVFGLLEKGRSHEFTMGIDDLGIGDLRQCKHRIIRGVDPGRSSLFDLTRLDANLLPGVVCLPHQGK